MGKNISFITQKRNKARTDFKKDFNKLIKNAFYGKTLEGVRSRKKSRIYQKR